MPTRQVDAGDLAPVMRVAGVAKTDAFIAALTSLVHTGCIGHGVHRPAAEHLEQVRSEGWIFFPV